MMVCYSMEWYGMVWNGMPVCMLIHVSHSLIQWKWFQHVSKLVDTAILPSLCPSNTPLMCQRKIIALEKSAKQRNMLKHPAFHVFFCLVRWQTTGNPWSTGPLKRWMFISHNFFLRFNSTTSRPTLLSVTAEWHGSRDHFWTDIFQSERLDFLFSQGACEWFRMLSTCKLSGPESGAREAKVHVEKKRCFIPFESGSDIYTWDTLKGCGPINCQHPCLKLFFEYPKICSFRPNTPSADLELICVLRVQQIQLHCLTVQ